MSISLNPKDMAEGGLPGDFAGTIREAVFTAWNYDGRREHSLFMRLTIEAADGETHSKGEEPGTVVQYYSAGSLDFFAPSHDGEDPVDLESDDEDDWAAPMLCQVGDRTQMSSNSNAAMFITRLQDAGYDGEIEDSLEFLVGMTGRFDQVPQPTRAGIQRDDDDEGRQKTLLVMTRYDGMEEEAPASKSKSKAKAKSKAKPKAASGGDVESTVLSTIQEAVEEAGDDGISQADLPQLVQGPFKAVKDKKAALKLANDTEFLGQFGEEGGEGEGWWFDSDEGHLYSFGVEWEE